MKRKRAILVLLCALSLPLPSTAVAMDDMFGVMFRMMLVMMNVMSDAMLDNNDTSDFGFGNNPFGSGMGAWPAMSGMFGMNPMSAASLYPAMSPWTGMGGFPGTSPWSSGMGGFPGTNPWSGMGGFPGYGSGMSPWSTPYMGDSWSSPYGGPYSPSGSPAGYGGVPVAPVSLIEGRWFGNSGEILEVRGNRFRLQHGKYGISGAISIENNMVNLFSPETGTVTQYLFIRNQSNLMLQDATGEVLSFTRRAGSGAAYVF